MGLPVLILGESGSGKTFSIKNFDADKVGVFAVEKQRLPFKKQFKVKKNATYANVMGVLQNPKLKTYIIDDSQYLMVNEFFDRAKETGYQKYTDIGLHFRNLVHFINHEVPDDVTVYFLHHTEIVGDTGKVKAKTVGKMLDNYLTVEGCFDIVLVAEVEGDNKHHFVTQPNTLNPAKSSEGMFEPKIPNDLAFVDATIRDYYGMDAVEENTDENEGEN